MPRIFRILALLLASACPIGADENRNIVLEHFPNRVDLGILCWSVPDGTSGYLSQIVVFKTERGGVVKQVWHSHFSSAYSPQIRFLREIAIENTPLAIVERQNGATTSQLDVLGISAGHVVDLLGIEGFKFDVKPLDGSKLPFIIAHKDANTLDVPEIYRWNGVRFVEDSDSHPNFYKGLLAENKTKLPNDLSGIVAVRLSKIALLSGNGVEARNILDEALSREQRKGQKANEETLRLINKALHDLLMASR